MLTNYHAAYYAHELNRVGGNGVDRLGRALFDACVDLNPHQIEAALFALRSPLSKGVLLADEVDAWVRKGGASEASGGDDDKQ